MASPLATIPMKALFEIESLRILGSILLLSPLRDFYWKTLMRQSFGVRQPDNEALRLDSVRNPHFGSLETYLNSGWIDGLLASSIKKLEINGLSAIVATARAGEWNFRIAVIQHGDFLYRLIFAARALTDSVDQSFLQSINSFAV